jgi:hypothetical protein
MSVEHSESALMLDTLTEIMFQSAKWTRHTMTAACEGCGETIKNQDWVWSRSRSFRHTGCPTEDAKTATDTENARRSNLKVQIPSEISKLLPSNLKDGTQPERVLSFLERKVDKLGGVRPGMGDVRPGMGVYGPTSRRGYLNRMMRALDDKWEDHDALSDHSYVSDDGRGSDDGEGSPGINQEDLLRKFESARRSIRSQMDAKERVGRPSTDVTRSTADVSNERAYAEVSQVTVEKTMLSQGWSMQFFSPTYGKKVCSLPACPQKTAALAGGEQQPTLGDQVEAIWVDQAERLFLHQQGLQSAMDNDYMYQSETETAVDSGSETETED